MQFFVIVHDLSYLRFFAITFFIVVLTRKATIASKQLLFKCWLSCLVLQTISSVIVIKYSNHLEYMPIRRLLLIKNMSFWLNFIASVLSSVGGDRHRNCSTTVPYLPGDSCIYFMPTIYLQRKYLCNLPYLSALSTGASCIKLKILGLVQTKQHFGPPSSNMLPSFEHHVG